MPACLRLSLPTICCPRPSELATLPLPRRRSRARTFLMPLSGTASPSSSWTTRSRSLSRSGARTEVGTVLWQGCCVCTPGTCAGVAWQVAGTQEDACHAPSPPTNRAPLVSLLPLASCPCVRPLHSFQQAQRRRRHWPPPTRRTRFASWAWALPPTTCWACCAPTATRAAAPPRNLHPRRSRSSELQRAALLSCFAAGIDDSPTGRVRAVGLGQDTSREAA